MLVVIHTHIHKYICIIKHTHRHTHTHTRVSGTTCEHKIDYLCRITLRMGIIWICLILFELRLHCHYSYYHYLCVHIDTYVCVCVRAHASYVVHLFMWVCVQVCNVIVYSLFMGTYQETN